MDWLQIVLSVVVTVMVIFYIVVYIKNSELDTIRGHVYQLFLIAEHEFKYGDNDAKFEYVVDAARKLIPAPFNALITEKNLRMVIQKWFDLTKPLLDDGKK